MNEYPVSNENIDKNAVCMGSVCVWGSCYLVDVTEVLCREKFCDNTGFKNIELVLSDYSGNVETSNFIIEGYPDLNKGQSAWVIPDPLRSCRLDCRPLAEKENFDEFVKYFLHISSVAYEAGLVTPTVLIKDGNQHKAAACYMVVGYKD